MIMQFSTFKITMMLEVNCMSVVQRGKSLKNPCRLKITE